jgi:hypothetical protein
METSSNTGSGVRTRSASRTGHGATAATTAPVIVGGQYVDPEVKLKGKAKLQEHVRKVYERSHSTRVCKLNALVWCNTTGSFDFSFHSVVHNLKQQIDAEETVVMLKTNGNDPLCLIFARAKKASLDERNSEDYLKNAAFSVMFEYPLEDKGEESEDEDQD